MSVCLLKPIFSFVPSEADILSPLHSHTPRNTDRESQPYPVPGVYTEFLLMMNKPGGTSLSLLTLAPSPVYQGCSRSTRGSLAWWGHNSLSFCLPCLFLQPILVFLGMIFLAKNLYTIPGLILAHGRAHHERRDGSKDLSALSAHRATTRAYWPISS